MISPILIKNETFGYISLLKEQGEFDEMEVLSLERAATLCALHLLNEITAFETEQRIRGEFIYELLSGSANREDLSYRLKLAGYDLSLPHYLFLFHLKDQTDITRKEGEAKTLELRKKIAETIFTEIKNQGQRCLVSSKLDQIVAVIPEGLLKKLRTDPLAYGKALVQKLYHKLGVSNIVLGISSLCKDVKEYKKGYEEAIKAINISKIKKLNAEVVSFDELGLIARICSDENEAEMKNFALKVLGDIIGYDQKYGTELIKTLYHYLENQGNVLQTSRSMMISVGSIKYRIHRIQEIANLDLSSPRDFYNARLALEILVFLGVIDTL